MHKNHHKHLLLFSWILLIVIYAVINFIPNIYSLKLQAKTQILLLFILSFSFGIFITFSKLKSSKKMRIFTLWTIIIVVFNISNEKNITDTIIIDNGPFIVQLVSATQHTKFYEPCYIFLKKEFHWDSKHELELLESKYNMRFQIKKTAKDKRIYCPQNHNNTNIYITAPPTFSNIYGEDTFSDKLVTSLEKKIVNSKKTNIHLIEEDNKTILLCPASNVQEDFATSIYNLIKEIQHSHLLKKSQVTIYYKIEDFGVQSELQTITIDNTLTFLEAKQQNKSLTLEHLKNKIYILYYQLSKTPTTTQ